MLSCLRKNGCFRMKPCEPKHLEYLDHALEVLREYFQIRPFIGSDLATRMLELNMFCLKTRRSALKTHDPDKGQLMFVPSNRMLPQLMVFTEKSIDCFTVDSDQTVKCFHAATYAAHDEKQHQTKKCGIKKKDDENV